MPQHTRCRKLSKPGFVFAEKFGPKKFRPLLPFFKKKVLVAKFFGDCSTFFAMRTLANFEHFLKVGGRVIERIKEKKVNTRTLFNNL